MSKKKMIGKVYKLLKIYETETEENYKSYLSKLIYVLDGEDNDWLDESISMLKGIRRSSDVTHDEIRSIVLHITNTIDRNYVG